MEIGDLAINTPNGVFSDKSLCSIDSQKDWLREFFWRWVVRRVAIQQIRIAPCLL